MHCNQSTSKAINCVEEELNEYKSIKLLASENDKPCTLKIIPATVIDTITAKLCRRKNY